MKANDFRRQLHHAVMLAAWVHTGQVDKAGQPYILHVLRVIMGAPIGPAQIVAALHDVVEDTWTSLDDLRSHGFSEVVVQAVDATSKREGEPYGDYIQRVSENGVARLAKIADLMDNVRIERIPEPTPGDHERTMRYENALHYLNMVQHREALAPEPVEAT